MKEINSYRKFCFEIKMKSDTCVLKFIKMLGRRHIIIIYKPKIIVTLTQFEG